MERNFNACTGPKIVRFYVALIALLSICRLPENSDVWATIALSANA